MRHQPLLVGDRVEEFGVDLDGVDRGEAKPRQLGHLARIARTRAPSAGAGKVGAVGGDVDAGQHDFAIAVVDEAADLIDDGGQRHRARIAAAVRDDAEGAAVVAAVLHLDEGAGAPVDALDRWPAVSRTVMMSLTWTRAVSATPRRR